jgi:Ca2+-binding RTX toxin-like protein
MSILRGQCYRFIRSPPRRKGGWLATRVGQNAAVRVEQLETRQLLAMTLNSSTGLLTIDGTNHSDHVSVEFAGQSQIQVSQISELAVFPVGSVTSILFTGKGGRDHFQNLTDIPAVAMGGPGPDTLIGGSGNDTLAGGTGADLLTGNGGDDRLDGQSGTGDTLEGGEGDDDLFGGSGRDTLLGGDGSDNLNGGYGNDSVFGDDGDDTLVGGGNQDSLSGGNGDDLLQSVSEVERRTVHVTTLSPDGPGSLSDAISQGNRHIVFDVGGTIDLRSTSAERPDYELVLSESNITIDGSSAPAPGISIVGARLLIQDASNITILHITILQGDDPVGVENRGQRDTLTIHSSEDVLIRNVSLYWSQDELADIWGSSRRITFDRVLFAEPLDKDNHAHGLLAGNGASEVAITNSVFASPRKRAPKFAFGTEIDGQSSGLMVNNIIYNPLSRTVIIGDGAKVAAVGNLVLPGPDSQGHIAFLEAQPGVGSGTEVFLSDNFFQDADLVMVPNAGRTTPLFTAPVTFDNPEAYDWNVSYKAGVGSVRGLTPAGVHDPAVNAPPEQWMADRLAAMNVLPVDQVFDQVLFNVGATPWSRTSGDNRVISGIVNGTGRKVETTAQVGGMPAYVFVAPSPESARIATSEEADLLFGGAGNDTIVGGVGNDQLNGETGDDVISGGIGDDELIGDFGSDTLNGDAGDDLLTGREGTDFVFGGLGNDIAVWQSGHENDFLNGDLGTDELQVIASDNNDWIQLSAVGQSLHVDLETRTLEVTRFERASIEGRRGDDRITTDALVGFVSNYPTYRLNNFEFIISGDQGQDTIDAAAAVDGFIGFTIDGGADADVISLPLAPVGAIGTSIDANSASGGDGDDTIVGGLGNETIDGGNGNDSLVGAEGDDTLLGQEGNDTLEGGAGADMVEGHDGDDDLNGNGDQDTLDGGDGNDRLVGGGSSDVLYGRGGNDVVIGNSGDDLLMGGSGSDTLDAGDGNDQLFGGLDNDLLVGGADDDLLDGGVEQDTLATGGGSDTIFNVGDDLIDEAYVDWFKAGFVAP